MTSRAARRFSSMSVLGIALMFWDNAGMRGAELSARQA